MFSLKDFIKSGLLDAVGKLADYQVILNAAGWMEKGVLSEEDLADIDAKIVAKKTAIENTETIPEQEELLEEPPVEESPVEEQE